ncbi:MAG: pectate lyase [Asticcacaulis sp.]
MDRRQFFAGLALTSLIAPEGARAAKIGVNPAFPPLNAERIQTLPEAERASWRAYLDRSAAQMQADKAALRAERQDLAEIPADAQGGPGDNGMALDKPADWYRSAEARTVTANILSFQTPAGGWGKNHPRNAPPRLKGQAYILGNEPARPAGHYDTHAPYWHYVGTTDNGATITEIRFLARVASVTGDETVKSAALKGLDYFLKAQFPNGGWPQVWPLEGGYHDAITLNDYAMGSVVTLIGEAARGQGDFSFVPREVRTRLSEAEARAIDCFLKSQVRVDGRLTLWAPQYDALTLTPCSARAFEPPALSCTDSAALLIYLMQQPSPSKALKAAVKAGIETLEATMIRDVDFVLVPDIKARRLVSSPGRGMWGRYLDLRTLKPIFGTRERDIYDALEDIETPGNGPGGYRWYSSSPGKAISAYARWRA